MGRTGVIARLSSGRGVAPVLVVRRHEDDILTFLLDWCPRHLALPAEVAGEVCEALVEFSLFLGHRGRLRGGFARGRSLARRTNTLRTAMRPVIADQTKDGTATSADACIKSPAPDLAEVDLNTLASEMYFRTEGTVFDVACRVEAGVVDRGACTDFTP